MQSLHRMPAESAHKRRSNGKNASQLGEIRRKRAFFGDFFEHKKVTRLTAKAVKSIEIKKGGHSNDPSWSRTGHHP